MIADCVPTLSVLGANQWQVGVLADLLIELQRLSQCSLFIDLILNLLGALQQLVRLSGRHATCWSSGPRARP